MFDVAAPDGADTTVTESPGGPFLGTLFVGLLLGELAFFVMLDFHSIIITCIRMHIKKIKTKRRQTKNRGKKRNKRRMIRMSSQSEGLIVEEM